MVNKKLMVIGASLATISAAAAFSLVTFGHSGVQPSEPDYSAQYNEDCTPKGLKNLVVAEAKHGGVNYVLVIGSKTGADGWIYSKDVLIQRDAAGCKALTSGSFIQALPTDQMALQFAEAYWRHQASTPVAKKGLEEFLATTPVATLDSNSMTIMEADIAAFKKLGIKYPSYLKGIDTFASFDEAEAYYAKIFTRKWFKENTTGKDPHYAEE